MRCHTWTTRGGPHGRRQREGSHQADRRRRGRPAHIGTRGGADLDRGLPKGDALATARVAGIQAAKRTSELIPLCHQLALTGVDIDFDVAESDIEITATVRSTDRTGVEMEALSAVSVAALTLYDMIKAVDPAARIDDIRVLRKEGGKTGMWTRS